LSIGISDALEREPLTVVWLGIPDKLPLLSRAERTTFYEGNLVLVEQPRTGLGGGDGFNGDGNVYSRFGKRVPIYSGNHDEIFDASGGLTLDGCKLLLKPFEMAELSLDLPVVLANGSPRASPLHDACEFGPLLDMMRKQYRIRIRAHNEEGASEWSEPLTTPLGTPPVLLPMPPKIVVRDARTLLVLVSPWQKQRAESSPTSLCIQVRSISDVEEERPR